MLFIKKVHLVFKCAGFLCNILLGIFGIVILGLSLKLYNEESIVAMKADENSWFLLGRNLLFVNGVVLSIHAPLSSFLFLSNDRWPEFVLSSVSLLISWSLTVTNAAGNRRFISSQRETMKTVFKQGVESARNGYQWPEARKFVDVVQSTRNCCGIKDVAYPMETDGISRFQFPLSCCAKKNVTKCMSENNKHISTCRDTDFHELHNAFSRSFTFTVLLCAILTLQTIAVTGLVLSEYEETGTLSPESREKM